MKKISKVILIASAIMIAVGLILVTIGFATGGTKQVIRWARDGELSVDFNIAGFSIPDMEFDFDDTYDTYSGSISKTEAGTLDEIESLDIQIGACVINLVTTSEDTISISSKNVDKFQYYVKNKTLYVKEEGDMFPSTESEITLYLPEKLVLKEALVDIGAGLFEADNIQADKIDLEVGAGKADVKQITSKDVIMEIGAGEIILETAEIKDFNVSVGMGRVSVEGKLMGDVTADVAMGSLEMELAGDEDDFNYVLECSMGNIQVGNHNYNSIDMDESVNNNAEKEMNLECDMGNIRVDFK